MPKERIAPIAGRFEIGVGWHVDEGVQVEVAEAAGFSLVTALYGDAEARRAFTAALIDRGVVNIPPGPCTMQTEKDAALEEIGRVILDAIESSASAVGTPYESVWAHLDRRGCNALIRVLRRARDTAFGRDE